MKGEKILNIIVIVFVVIVIFILAFTIYNLYRFGKCYNSEFTSNYCEYYKNY